MSKKKVKEFEDYVKLLEKIAPGQGRDNPALRRLEENFHNTFRLLTKRNMKPKGKKTRYVGLELEFFSNVSRTKMWKTLDEMKLINRVNVTSDTSIRCRAQYNPYELRFIIPEKQVEMYVNKIGEFLKKCKAQVNSSCGFHVHIDMRDRNYDKTLENLFYVQPIMKKLVKPDRIRNSFCRITNNLVEHNGMARDDRPFQGFSPIMPHRDLAINARHAYRKHKTFEIRLHHGTTDPKEIKNWINFLLSVVNSRRRLKKNLNTYKQVKDNFALRRGVDQYVKSAFSKKKKKKAS